MNYRIFMTGKNFKIYDECVKLLVYSAEQSDYIVKINGFHRGGTCSAKTNQIILKGSSKDIFTDIIIDYDGIVIDYKNQNAIVISPDSLELHVSPEGNHYWSSIGALFKIINDLSPAYVTGYLLENKNKKEMESFNSCLTKLPFGIQIALNEVMTDK